MAWRWRSVGEGVKLVGEDELVATTVPRKGAGSSNRASQGVCRLRSPRFIRSWPHVSPVYAQLRNCIDLAVAAAFIQHQDFYGSTGWIWRRLETKRSYPVETLNAPKKVASAVNSMWKGSTLMTPIGGGVQIQPTEAPESANQQQDEDGVVTATREEVEPKNLTDTQWWWD